VRAAELPERIFAAVPERGRGHVLTVVGLLLTYLALLASSLHTTSVTTDEFGHLPLGYGYLESGDSRWLLMGPPLQPVIAAIPLWISSGVHWVAPRPREDVEFWWAGFAFMQAFRDRYQDLYQRARAAVAVLAVITGLLVYGFARALGGGRAGLMALGLFAFSPDFLAHGGLATTDLSAALAGLAAVYGVYQYRRRRTVGRLLLAGAGVGTILLAKFSALLLLPLVPVMLAWPESRLTPLASKTHATRRVGELLALAAIALLMLAAAYRFQWMFPRWGSLTWKSDLMGAVAAAAPWLRLPLPGAWLTALDRQLFDATRPWTVYLLGRVSLDREPLYYPVCLLYKTPLALLGLLAIGAALNRDRRPAGWALGPGMWLLAALLLFPGKQYGSRVMLPALAFLIVWAGVALTGVLEARSRLKPLAQLIVALLLWYAVDTVRAFPHYLAYFNELAGGPGQPNRGGQVLADSNLDWGQDWIRLAAWQRESGVGELQLGYYGLVDPAIYGVKYRLADCRIEPGWMAVSANLVQGVDSFRMQRECYRQLAGRAPAARPGPAVLVYRIP
jgi:hypothetical protein